MMNRLTRYGAYVVAGSLAVVLGVAVMLALTTTTGEADEPVATPAAYNDLFACMVDQGYAQEPGVGWRLPDGSTFPPKDAERGEFQPLTDAMARFFADQNRCAEAAGVTPPSSGGDLSQNGLVEQFYGCMERLGWETPARLSGPDEPPRYDVDPQVTSSPEWQADRSTCMAEVGAQAG